MFFISVCFLIPVGDESYRKPTRPGINDGTRLEIFLMRGFKNLDEDT
jgi:hypothetical protein